MAMLASIPETSVFTVADFLTSLGNIPASRVLMKPIPGTATEKDLLDQLERHDRICELLDGILVQKTMGYLESLLAGVLIEHLRSFVKKKKLGIVLTPDGPVRLLSGQIRVPDVCFIRWERLPGKKLPRVPILPVAPDLAVEILSPGNTHAEMERKLSDYFAAGVRLVWYIDPAARMARIYTAPEKCSVLDDSQSLSGNEVLPGFQLALAELFGEIDDNASDEV
jgi:Uma2 family endonuclease